MSLTPDISRFKVFEEPNEAKYISNYVNKNVLLSYYDKVKNVTDLTRFPIEYLDTHRPSLNKDFSVFYDFFINSSTTREIETDLVEWKLKSDTYFRPTSNENLHPGVARPGQGGAEFQISLNFGGWSSPDIIYPEISPESQVIIVGNPLPDSAFGWIYNVKIAYGTENDYFDPQLLAEGIKWQKMGAGHGEASGAYGSMTITPPHTYIVFQSGLSSINKMCQVTDDAHKVNLSIRRVDASGLPVDGAENSMIISTIEAEFMRQIKNEKGKTMWMSRSTHSVVPNKNAGYGRLIDETSGYPIKKGPGIEEFLIDGNVKEYPLANFTIDGVVNYLQSVWYDSVPWQNRRIVFYTGSGGLQLWQDAIARKFTGYGAHIPFEKVAKPTSAGDVPGSKVSKYTFSQPFFTEYELFPGGVVTVAYLPILDSRELWGAKKHPVTGIPLKSYEFIALDYGTEDGGPNVELLHRKNSEALFYLCGAYSPVGPIYGMGGSSKGFTATHANSYYQLHYKDEFGVIVRNIKRTMVLKPAA